MLLKKENRENDTHKHPHKNYSFLGHERALCPCSLHIPHSLGRLAGGTPVSVVEEEDTVGVVVLVVVLVVVVEEDAVVDVLAAVEVLVVGLVTVGSGSAGLGQVVSLHSSGQNSRILL